MQRSTFVKLAATTTVAAGARLYFPWAAAAATRQIAYAGALYRAGGPGKIQISKDAGRTWKLHSNLGHSLSIKGFVVRGGRLHLSAGYAGRSFSLVLAKDKRTWRTA